MFVEKVGECLTPVVADRRGGWLCGARQRGKVRLQLVAAARAKLLEEVGRPVRLVYLEAVAEDRERWMVAERRQEPIADVRQIAVDRAAIVMVHDEPFGAYGRALD